MGKPIGGRERELTPTPRLGLIGQVSPLTSIEAGEPQGTILWLLLSSIYIKDLYDVFLKNTKLLADDTSRLSIVRNIKTWATHLNIGLRKINN